MDFLEVLIKMWDMREYKDNDCVNKTVKLQIKIHIALFVSSNK